MIFSRYLYITQMKYTPIFLNENRKKKEKTMCILHKNMCENNNTYG